MTTKTILQPPDHYFQFGVKRTRRAFFRALRLQLNVSEKGPAMPYVRRKQSQITSFLWAISDAFVVINDIGLNPKGFPPRTVKGFLAFHDALNLLFVGLQNIFIGSALGSLAIARQALEVSAIATIISLDEKSWQEFGEGKLKSTKCISLIRHRVPHVGSRMARVYGILSNEYVHVAQDSIGTSIVTEPLAVDRRVAIGAFYHPEKHREFETALRMSHLLAIYVKALAEYAIFPHLLRPSQYWAEDDQNIVWSPDEIVIESLEKAETNLEEIRQPDWMILPHVSEKDREEIGRLCREFSIKNFTEIEELKRADSKYPNSVVVALLLASALQEVGDYEGALKRYQKVADKEPTKEHVLFRTARLLERLGEIDQALKYYDLCLRHNEKDWQALNQIGLIRDKRNEFEEALQAFRRAQKIKPEYFNGCFNEGRTLQRMGKYEAAIQKFDKAVRYDPNARQAYYNKGLALLHLDNLSEAYYAFRKAVLVDPGYLPGWINLSGVCLMRDMPVRAVLCAKYAVALEPESIEARINLTRGLIILGSHEKATEQIEQLRGRAPDKFIEELISELESI